jgi:Rieske 2Fe-2S family protein
MVMAHPLASSELERVLAPLDRARPFGGRAYVDEDVFAFERDIIFGRTWICVGRIDEVALPGQWLRAIVGGEPVVVVRGADLELHAFFDVCRHRGASVVGRAPCGRTARFTCPYHGWTYELDGRLAAADFMPRDFAAKEHGLSRVRTGAWRGFVFATLDEAAPPLDAWLGQRPPWLHDPVLDTLARGRRREYEVAANWKLCVENFQESHHFPLVHAELERLTPTSGARSWLSQGPWLGGTMEIADAETVARGGSRHDRPFLVPEERRRTVHDAMLFPSLLTSLQPDYLLTYRLTPLGAARTAVIADIYFHPAAFIPGFAPDDVFDFWDRVNDEDRAICEAQQANASSRAFDPAGYATVEEGVHAFDRMVAAAHLAHGRGPK